MVIAVLLTVRAVSGNDYFPLAKVVKVTVASHHTYICTKRMLKHRALGGYARDEDGKQTSTVHSPGGNTQVGTQTFSTTPNGHNEARLFTRPDEEDALRKDNVQSIRDSREKPSIK